MTPEECAVEPCTCLRCSSQCVVKNDYFLCIDPHCSGSEQPVEYPGPLPCATDAWEVWWAGRGATLVEKGTVKTSKNKLIRCCSNSVIYEAKALPGEYLVLVASGDAPGTRWDGLFHERGADGGNCFYTPLGPCGAYRVNGSVQRYVPTRPFTTATATICEKRAVDCALLYPMDEAAMRFLDGFHRQRFVHVDPTSPNVPRRRWVQAPAGSGKTTFLLNLAKHFPDKSFLLITFSKSLADDVNMRKYRGNISNLEVRTMDSLCFHSSGCYEQKGDENAFYLSDSRIVRNFFPNCFKWYTKRGSRDIAAVCEMVLKSTSVDLAKTTDTLCEEHSRINPEYVLDGMWGSSGKKRRLWCHSGNRYTVWHSKQPMRAFCTPDCVLVDEVQDLDPQAIEIIEQFTQPIVYVGDAMQRVFSFQDENKCRRCREIVPPESASLFPDDQTISLYATFRIGAPSVRVLRDLCFDDVPFYSAAKPCNDGTVVFVRGNVAPQGKTFLFRANAQVCEFALEHPSAVLRANKIMVDVNRIAKATHKKKELPFEKYVHALTDEKRDRLLEILTVHCGDDTVVGTVHAFKGSEADTVAVHYALFVSLFQTNVNPEERRIAWVACTRHRKTLIVYGVPEEEKDEEDTPRKKRRLLQTSMDVFLKL